MHIMRSRSSIDPKASEAKAHYRARVEIQPTKTSMANANELGERRRDRKPPEAIMCQHGTTRIGESGTHDGKDGL